MWWFAVRSARPQPSHVGEWPRDLAPWNTPTWREPCSSARADYIQRSQIIGSACYRCFKFQLIRGIWPFWGPSDALVCVKLSVRVRWGRLAELPQSPTIFCQ
jgi:hypothetical protein